jgi:hypothetical protein
LEGPADETETTWPERHGTAFCALAAACLVGLRLVLFDSRFFRGECIPNHDMSQGLAFFATDLHSLRLGGEIAWWNPFSSTGYAQYYQSFLSPLAPTPHHLTFVVWASVVRLLAWLHVPAPSEYEQYLAFNYLLLPFLTLWALGELMRGLVRHPAAILLAMATYALSSIGIWSSAWFYWQESCTLLFLLATFVHALRRPTVGRIALLGVAVLVQVTSLNYWSAYNALFVAIVLATIACCEPRELARLLRAVVDVVRGRRAGAVAVVLFAATIACWIVLIASIAREQSTAYVRTYASAAPGAAAGTQVVNLGAEETAATRAKPVRTFTIELFNPGIEIALENYPVTNPGGLEPPVHNARYLGAALLPLLALVPFLRWSRATAWVIPAAALVFIVCLVPAPLADVVVRIPFLAKIQHLFYFYTAHWQLLVVVLSACALDAVLAPPEPRLRRRLLLVCSGVAGVAIAALAALPLARAHLPGADVHLGSYVRALGVASISVAAVTWMLIARTERARNAGAVLLLATSVVDLGWYFAHVSAIDQNFTVQYWHVPAPMTADYRARLFAALPDPDTSLGFDAGLADALPIVNDFWPTNRYLLPVGAIDAGRHMDVFGRLDWAQPLALYRESERTSDAPLVLVRDATDAAGRLRWQWLDWSYADFAVRFTAEFPGWLLLRQLYDPLWRFTVDGEDRSAEPANFIGTALRVDGGTHELRMSYRPRARGLYGPASMLLVITVTLLLVMGVGSDASRSAAGGAGRDPVADEAAARGAAGEPASG